MAKRIAVVVSQGQSQNPAKRSLEEDLVAALMMEPGVDVTVIPHLYDLRPDGTGMLALQGIAGNLVVISWLYERAARWILDRNGISGHPGPTLIRPDEAEEDDEEDEQEEEQDEHKERVVDQRELPNRKIYCLDLRAHNTPQPYVDEVKRIAQENSTEVVQLGSWIQGTPKPDQMQRFLDPNPKTSGNGSSGNGSSGSAEAGGSAMPKSAIDGEEQEVGSNGGEVKHIREEAQRRWYPVIDYSRCTNCMECIDFCLFGVYGVDRLETILVEQPDNCRKGCPACSRVCPENAIIFPQHKTPAIAGSPAATAGMKIDLSKLFGAPEGGKSALEMAALERDEQLMMAGRETVGMTVGMPKRQADKAEEPKDELDDLIDELDELEL